MDLGPPPTGISPVHGVRGRVDAVDRTRLDAAHPHRAGEPHDALGWPPGSFTVAVTLFVFGSIRDTVPSSKFDTQADPFAAATNRGLAPTFTVATTRFEAGSMRATVSPPQVGHPYVAECRGHEPRVVAQVHGLATRFRSGR
jgi:hypothetical protein